jgi:HPt (histidine-containing phosphotransfer) domain-containing protein
MHDASVLDELLRTTDRHKVIDIVERFRADGTARLVQLREAIASDDRDTVLRSAHALRGSSAMLGAGRVSEGCSMVEAAARAADPVELEAALVELENALTSTGGELQAQVVSAA